MKNISKFDLIDIYTMLHPTTAEYTFFLSAHITPTKMENILGDKTSLNKFKCFESIQNRFPDHNRTKLDIKTERYLDDF